MSAVLNNFTKYSLTYLASTKVLFGFKIKELLNLLGPRLKLEDLLKQSSEQTP